MNDPAETIHIGKTLSRLDRSGDLVGKSYGVNMNLKFIKKLGRGGMGDVYLAEMESDGVSSEVAVKFSSHSNLPELATEAQISNRLTHDYIARTHSFHILEGDTPSGAIIMAYVDGEDLLELSRMHAQLGLKMPQKFTGLLGYLVCEALEYSHKEGAIHRDMKPANIMVERKSGSPKVIDFGLGVLSQDTPDIIGQVCGTLDFMAPEIIRGNEIDHRADIYGLGMTLDSLIRGESFLARSSQSASSNRLGDRVKAIRDLQDKGYEPLSILPGIHPTLSQIVERSVKLDPGERYADANEMMNALSGFNYGQGLGFGPVRAVFQEYLTLIRHPDLPAHLKDLKSDRYKKPEGNLRDLIERLKSPGSMKDYQVIGNELLLETLPGNYNESIPGFLPIG